MIVLVTGGSGCGKSAFAESLIPHLPAEGRLYLATMAAMDAESRRRIERHRAARAHLGMETVERTKNLGELALPQGGLALLEDLPNWLAGEMFGGGDAYRVIPQLRALAGSCRHLIAVTNDVFSDGVRYEGETALYLRRLAEINRAAAALSDTVCELVYSIPVVLKGDLP